MNMLTESRIALFGDFIGCYHVLAGGLGSESEEKVAFLQKASKGLLASEDVSYFLVNL